MASVAAVYLYRLTDLLFNDRNVSRLATLIYLFFPLTLWWTQSFCTESLFQSCLIISIYYLVLGVQNSNRAGLLFSAFWFSVCFLMKSHILLFAPAIVIYLAISKSRLSNKIINIRLYAFICILLALPWALYNFKQHQTLVLSSNGGLFHFYTGNHWFGYYTIVNPPLYGSAAHAKLLNFDLASYNGPMHDSIMKLPQSVKQKRFFEASLLWIENHPNHFIRLKIYHLVRFILPGVGYNVYSFKVWLAVLLISLPIYIPAYLGMYYRVRQDFRKHGWIFMLFLVMLCFSVIFYVQNRFRTITLEPFYFIYASYSLNLLLRKIKWLPPFV
jgi:4-amino-4-deoxy-L-arabinose transferase-like glycosyltransferase